jgi:hypothetical protein
MAHLGGEYTQSDGQMGLANPVRPKKRYCGSRARNALKTTKTILEKVVADSTNMEP